MAKRKSIPKGLRDLKNIPGVRWNSDRDERPNFLIYDAPAGTYEIDKIVLEMIEQGAITASRSEPENLADARELIDLAASVAIQEARDELSAPMHYRAAIALREDLKAVLIYGRRIGRADIAGIANVISGPYAETTLEDLIDDIDHVTKKLDRYLDRVEIHHRPASEPLTSLFISFCLQFWHTLTGRSLDKHEIPSIRRFLAAAWVDVKFPEPTDRLGSAKPIDDHIRERLEASDIDRHLDADLKVRKLVEG